MRLDSLRYRFALLISLVAGILLALVIWLSVGMSHQVARSQLMTKEEVFSAFLEDITRTALLQGEYEVLQLYLEKLQKDPDIVRIRAADSRGIIVASTTPRDLGEVIPDSVTQEYETRRRPITNATGLIGTIEVQFSHHEINQQHRNVLKTSIFIGVFGFILVTGISLALGFLLTRRLVRLTDAAQRLAQGDLSVQVEQGGAPHDEIALLGEAFNTMARRLEAMVQELRTVNASLEDRVHERTVMLASANKELEQARDAAEAASVAKSSFLANMSHEIRTPMNAIIGMTHLALKTEMTLQQQEYLRKVTFAAESLLGIINDILDFSKIEAGRMEMEQHEFQLEGVLDRLTMLLSGKMLEKKLEFLVESDPAIPPVLVGDALRLGQVLINLCNNAAKFTDQGEVVLTITLVSRSNTQVQVGFAVRDTGIGMTREAITRLFRPFSQADTSTTRKYGGTGLGLAICKQLVELMDGELHVVSEPGKGSEFSFTARFGISNTTLQQQQLVTETDLRGRRVLVVDDNRSAREIFDHQLSSLSFEVTCIPTAVEALAELHQAEQKQHPYDLVIMDWIMPELDGFEAARMIRAATEITHPPRIIMATAYGSEEAAQRVASEGLDGYITKPANLSVLFDGIMTAFGRERKRSQRQKQYETSNSSRLATIRGGRVMLVEDNEFNQQVAMELLTSAGLEVTLAQNGAEAVNMISICKPDLVFMDIQMPVMDGYEATRLIRSMPDYGDIPIIAMTAHAMTSDKERCLKAGMDAYIAKPIVPDELTELLLSWVPPVIGEASSAPDKDAAPVSGTPDLPGDLEGIDPVRGLTHCNNNQELYRKLLGHFRERRRGADQELRSLLAEGRRDEARRAAHTLKSVCGIIGAVELARAAQQLEELLAEPDTPVEAMLERLSRCLTTVITSLDRALAAPAPTADCVVADVQPGRCLMIARSIVPLLDTDLQGAIEQVSQLERCLSGEQLFQRLDELKECLTRFDIDSALEILHQLIELLEQQDGSHLHVD